MKQTKDIEYHKKILKLGVLKLEESKVHREAIVKLMATLNLSEKKKIQREMDEFFLEEMCGDDEDCPVWKKYRDFTEKKLPPRRNGMIAHYDWFYLSIYRGYLEEAIKDRTQHTKTKHNYITNLISPPF